MKVLLINGSPHAKGCTYTALSIVADELQKAERFKVGAAVVSARRMGTTSTLDELNKYFLHGEMPVASSRYWNAVHGNTPEQVMKDEEGLQTMRYLGRNMAFLIRAIRHERERTGLPEEEPQRIATNYIR